tara:strand:- start:3717 stop:4919 length:1203 start_codon:yes stop_codon:yes gene_type:complete
LTAETVIKQRILQKEAISFKEFMEIALYHSEVGYYTSAKSIIENFFTSPLAHPAFGASLCLQLNQMWKSMGEPQEFYVLEVGCGDGVLAQDIIGYAHINRLPFLDALEYVAVDRSKSLISSLSGIDGLNKVVSSLDSFKNVVGCVISNELLDSFPVNRFKIIDGEVYEIMVSLSNGRFCELLSKEPDPIINERLSNLKKDLPNNFEGEINGYIKSWVKSLSQVLSNGFVITIDYGNDHVDLYNPVNTQSSIRSYHRHAQPISIYDQIGYCDITSDVDFSWLISQSENFGLRSLYFLNQKEYLNRWGVENWIDGIRMKKVSQNVLNRNLVGIRQLVRDDAFGQFKVLIQYIGEESDRLDSILPTKEYSKSYPAPMLTNKHADYLSSKYPHIAEIEFDRLFF